MSPTQAGLLLAWIAIVLLAFALAGVLGEVRRLKLETNSELGLQIGQPAPFRVGAESAARGSFVLFADDSCPSCQRILPEFLKLATVGREGIDFVVVSPHDPPLIEGATPLTVGHRPDIVEQFRVPAFPFAVGIDGHGRVSGKLLVKGRPDLEQVLETVVALGTI